MVIDRPTRSYSVWFSQRVGSTLLTQALEDTGIAGRPREWFTFASMADLLAAYGASDALTLRDELWRRAMTDNGVIGVKYGMTEGRHRELMSVFAGALPDAVDPDGRIAWDAYFPACKHIFMTRRNKVRLAVSWWRAIKSEEWHRPNRSTPPTVVGDAPNRAPPADLIDLYSYDAIEHLFVEANLREADMQDQFDRWGIIPWTVVYEDFIASYEPTVRGVLDYLQIPDRQRITIPAAAFDKLADEVSAAWTQRFHRERTARLP
jgi:trehalose 2-sulfotransferase